MAIIPLEAGLDLIAALPDEPNDVGGLSSAELKAKFDEAGNTIKTYLNETLIPGLDGENLPLVYGAEGGQTIRQAIEEATVGILPDGSITEEKLAPGVGEAITDDLKAQLDELSLNTLRIEKRATEEEATTGTDDTKWMTPLTTKKSIDANIGSAFNTSALRYINRALLSLSKSTTLPITATKQASIRWLVLTPDKTKLFFCSGNTIYARRTDIGSPIGSYTIAGTDSVLLAHDNDTIAICYSGSTAMEIYRVYSDHIEAGPSTSFPTSTGYVNGYRALYTLFHSDTELNFGLLAGGQIKLCRLLKAAAALSTITTNFSAYPTSNAGQTTATSPLAFNVLNGVVTAYVAGSGNSGSYTLSTYVRFINSQTGTVTTVETGVASSAGYHQIFVIAPTEDGFFSFYPYGNQLKKYITTSGVPVLDFSMTLGGVSYYDPATAKPIFLIAVDDKLLLDNSRVMDVATHAITTLSNSIFVVSPAIICSSGIGNILGSSYDALNVSMYLMDILGVAATQFSNSPDHLLLKAKGGAIVLKEDV